DFPAHVGIERDDVFVAIVVEDVDAVVELVGPDDTALQPDVGAGILGIGRRRQRRGGERQCGVRYTHKMVSVFMPVRQGAGLHKRRRTATLDLSPLNHASPGGFRSDADLSRLLQAGNSGGWGSGARVWSRTPITNSRRERRGGSASRQSRSS